MSYLRDKWIEDHQKAIDERAEELILERLQDPFAFADMMTGIEHVDSIYPHLQRMLRSIDRACKGDKISIDAVLGACSDIQGRIMQETEVWRDECQLQAEKELSQ